MEPGLEDREEMLPKGFLKFWAAPQWSPAWKTGKSTLGDAAAGLGLGAAMEPGLEDREESAQAPAAPTVSMPQWSPAWKTGKSVVKLGSTQVEAQEPQWSPAWKTGKSVGLGHRGLLKWWPQWSPAWKTGKRQGPRVQG